MTLKNLMMLAMLGLFFTACDNKEDDIAGPTSDFTVTIENVVTPNDFYQSGTFAVPEGATDPAPIFPGDAYEFTFRAGPNVTPGDGGTRLSFVTMFVQSNDLFLAPDASGIELYDESGDPLGKNAPMDVTGQIKLWDAGTEVNELTGSDSQKPQQDPMANDVGTTENGVITEITNNTDGVNTYPDVDQVIKVTIANTNDTEFLVRIENVSNSMTIATPAKGAGTTAAVPMSPGVWVIHTADNPLFTPGDPATAGIEDIAEDGFIDVAIVAVSANTGLVVPLSPGVWAVHDGTENPIFTLGAPDAGEGLEAIAEDGSPSQAAASLAAKSNVTSSDFFNTPEGSSDPGAIGPGQRYEFSFTAEDGDYLSLATMFVQSNDWFYAFGDNGVALFPLGVPLNGELTLELELYDAGTEVDEYPGAGLNQVIRQSGADSGSNDDNTTIRLVSNPPAIVPELNQVIRVTITNR